MLGGAVCWLLLDSYLVELWVECLFNHCCFVLGFLLYVRFQVSVGETEGESERESQEQLGESEGESGGESERQSLPSLLPF